ncbi:MAG TPA: MFS transporter [Armatimonadetes bacterium]|mgnify:FL=1|nr:MFS transporter [Armatimonadota bacterium]
MAKPWLSPDGARDEMKDSTVSPSGHEGINRESLFWLSNLALVTAGMSFSVRGGVLLNLQQTFFDTVNPASAATLATQAAGYAFLGLAFGVLVGSPLCDVLGMGTLLRFAAALHIGGTVALLLIPQGTVDSYSMTVLVMSVGMAGVGLAHGFVEAVINPLIATIYPDDKTHRLNVLHAWWPGGIVIGGLIAATGLSWQVKVATIFVPAIIYGLWSLRMKFPATERVQAGVSNETMIRACLNPLFILLFLAMALTASSELAPGQWVDAALTRTVGMRGIWLLIYVSALMFVGRHFAGTFAHRLSPIGLMAMSCIGAAIGLWALSIANSPITGFLAATIWGLGVCFMWPTMLGITSERFAEGGALALGIIGSMGNAAIYFALPAIGRVFDAAKIAAAGSEVAFNSGSPAQVEAWLVEASTKSFQFVAWLPAVLVPIFVAWWLYDRSRGGYRATNLLAEQGIDPTAPAVVED